MVGELRKKTSHFIYNLCARVDQLLILGMVIPPLMGNPYNRYYINLYYMVDDHPYHREKTMGGWTPGTYTGTGDIFCQYLYLPRGAKPKMIGELTPMIRKQKLAPKLKGPGMYHWFLFFC